jgi:hypothetical protein
MMRTPPAKKISEKSPSHLSCKQEKEPVVWLLFYEKEGKTRMLESFSAQDVLFQYAPWIEKRPDFLLGVMKNGALHQFSKEKTKLLTLRAVFNLTLKQAKTATEEDYKKALYFLHTLHPAVLKPADYKQKRAEIYKRVCYLRSLPSPLQDKKAVLARQKALCREMLSKDKQRE